MIPRLDDRDEGEGPVRAYLQALRKAGFSGDIDHGSAAQVVFSTDNSIYELLPRAVLFPRAVSDISLAVRILARDDFKNIVLAPRGGGTGTNGQSLTSGVVMDLSRHLNRILEINVAEGWARVVERHAQLTP